ncbi:hypothetical protein CBOM_00258 [Ceraceosorus bombacis]|uniref:Uncharacterized protein n=1 Tax=Ceraceosorus bombacis TaxID=401625 RepID=A0A0P1B8R2_9BASI|nr:hypothetical protein CBOM_00258 [Ceraceosorus bombacis]
MQKALATGPSTEQSAASRTFALAELRSEIFRAHHDLFLSSIPQPEPHTLPLLSVKDKLDEEREASLAALEAFLEVHGYRAACLLDRYSARPQDLKFQLHLSHDLIQRPSGPEYLARRPPPPPHNLEFYDQQPTDLDRQLVGSHANERNLFGQRCLSSFGGLQFQADLLDAVISTQYSRPSRDTFTRTQSEPGDKSSNDHGASELPDKPLLVLRLNLRASQQLSLFRHLLHGRRDLLADPECPIVPFVDFLDYGLASTILIHPVAQRYSTYERFPTRHDLHMRRRIEMIRDAVCGLVWLHRAGISLNVFSRDLTFTWMYAGKGRPSRRFAGARVDSQEILEALPIEPSEPFPFGPGWVMLPLDVDIYNGKAGLPWCTLTAAADPRVPGPRLWFANMPYASLTDKVKNAHPGGRKFMPYEGTYPNRFPVAEACSTPEDRAYLKAHPGANLFELPEGLRSTLDEPVPFDRFGRDVYIMGDLVGRLLLKLRPQERSVEPPKKDLLDSRHSERFDRVLRTPVNKLPKLPQPGPDATGFWGLKGDIDPEDDFVIENNFAAFPRKLADMALSMLEEDPQKRLSIQDAAKIVTEAHDDLIPKIVSIYEDWIKLQTVEAKEAQKATPMPSTAEEKAAYAKTIREEDPPCRLWMEHFRGQYLDVTEPDEAERDRLAGGEDVASDNDEWEDEDEDDDKGINIGPGPGRWSPTYLPGPGDFAGAELSEE